MDLFIEISLGLISIWFNISEYYTCLDLGFEKKKRACFRFKKMELEVLDILNSLNE